MIIALFAGVSTACVRFLLDLHTYKQHLDLIIPANESQKIHHKPNRELKTKEASA